MKLLKHKLSLLLYFFCCISCNTNIQQAASIKLKEKELTIQGELGQTSIHDFYIYNTGSKDLILYSVQGSCSCNTMTIEKNNIPTRDSSKVSVYFTPRNKGYKVETIFIESNDPLNSNTMLYIKTHTK